MGLEVGGYNDCPDWPKMGPSLLIATCLILAIRTAKWQARNDDHLSSPDFDGEIEFAARMARRVMVQLIRTDETIFPRRKQPWYQPNEDDVPR